MDKEITPLNKLLEWIEPTLESDKHIDKVSLIALVKSLLPTERQFAETCFDAGYNKGAYDYADYKEPELTFDNFFKQYSNE